MQGLRVVAARASRPGGRGGVLFGGGFGSAQAGHQLVELRVGLAGALLQLLHGRRAVGVGERAGRGVQLAKRGDVLGELGVGKTGRKRRLFLPVGQALRGAHGFLRGAQQFGFGRHEVSGCGAGGQRRFGRALERPFALAQRIVRFGQAGLLRFVLALQLVLFGRDALEGLDHTFERGFLLDEGNLRLLARLDQLRVARRELGRLLACAVKAGGVGLERGVGLGKFDFGLPHTFGEVGLLLAQRVSLGLDLGESVAQRARGSSRFGLRDFEFVDLGAELPERGERARLVGELVELRGECGEFGGSGAALFRQAL